MFPVEHLVRETVTPQGYVLETLLCPRSGLLKTSRLCRKTLLVSSRLDGGAATGPLVMHHQDDERERLSNQAMRLRAFRPATPSQSLLYIRRSRQKAQPCVSQLDGRLGLSPQRLRSHKALQIKRLFPREHVIHGATQLVREYGERFGFAVFVFEFGKIFFSWLTLADKQHSGFGKGPA